MEYGAHRARGQRRSVVSGARTGDLSVWERWQNGYCTGLENRRPKGLGGSNPSRSVEVTSSLIHGPRLLGRFWEGLFGLMFLRPLQLVYLGGARMRLLATADTGLIRVGNTVLTGRYANARIVHIAELVA